MGGIHRSSTLNSVIMNMCDKSKEREGKGEKGREGSGEKETDLEHGGHDIKRKRKENIKQSRH